jgi:hypothetical protein
MILRERYPDMPSLLAAIRHRPEMFLGESSLSRLDLLLAGIGFAVDFHEIPISDRMGGFDFAEFEKWIEEKYNPSRLSLRSFGLAAREARSDSVGLELWYEWYDEFNRSNLK